ncbi:hypothetical protein HK096_001251 [Nowakowskiella sp. JEL0078]|nr:hypothetical protein HK096_001251 [Nowakowskiella sp. JEL0078]
MANDVLNSDQSLNHSVKALSVSTITSLPGSFPSNISIATSLENEPLTKHFLKNFDSVEQTVAEASWNVLEQFSRVTHLYRIAAGKVLNLEPVRPYVDPQLLTLAGLENKQTNTPNHTFADLPEYEPTQVYLTQWTHDLQVSRLEEMEQFQQKRQLHEQMNTKDFSGDIINVDKLSELSIVENSLSLSTKSFDVSKNAAKMAVVRSKSWWKSSLKQRQNSMIKNDDKIDKRHSEVERHIVWDETVEAETELGMFEVLSVCREPKLED